MNQKSILSASVLFLFANSFCQPAHGDEVETRQHPKAQSLAQSKWTYTVPNLIGLSPDAAFQLVRDINGGAVSRISRGGNDCETNIVTNQVPNPGYVNELPHKDTLYFFVGSYSKTVPNPSLRWAGSDRGTELNRDFRNFLSSNRLNLKFMDDDPGRVSNESDKSICWDVVTTFEMSPKVGEKVCPRDTINIVVNNRWKPYDCR